MPSFSIFPFSISHSKVINTEIFVKDVSGTTSSRILKFGTNIRYDRLYCVYKNQPHMAYQSLYLSSFLSFQQFFHLISVASISEKVFKFCFKLHNENNQVYYCKNNQDAEIYFCFLCLFFLFSISHSNVMNMEIFVKDFSGTTLLRIKNSVQTSDMTSCTVYKKFSHIFVISPFIFPFFFLSN